MLSHCVRVQPHATACARMILLHGAGAPVQSEFFIKLQQQLALHGIESIAMNLAYMEQVRLGHKRPPPKLDLLIAEFTASVAQLLNELQRIEAPALPLLLAGKSMGGRIITQLLADAALTQPWPVQPQAGVVFGYPWCPAKQQQAGGEAMAKHLAARCGCWPMLQKPVMVLQGTRDTFGSPEQLQRHYQQLAPAQTMLQVQPIAGACHDFKGKPQLFEQLGQMVALFIRQVTQGASHA